MGAGVSNWELARAVSVTGQLGVVSGIALEILMTQRLSTGDQGGHVRRALAAFPDQGIAERILSTYFKGSDPGKVPARLPRSHRLGEPAELTQETIAAAFAEIFLAKEGHANPVGINLLTKIQLPILASLYGAMLANVDFVIMGAGIPREIPGILDRLAGHQDVSMAVQVEDANGDEYRVSLRPRELVDISAGQLVRPRFYPIVSSNLLATTMVRKATGRVDGLVVEGRIAGGHNAPPRGELTLDGEGEPVYGPKDEVDIERIAGLGLPFYLGGAYGLPGKLKEALAAGARGVQVGSLFAFCRESGLAASLKEAAIGRIARGFGKVVTDTLVSPTGFPFKVFELEGTLSDVAEYLTRPRVCDFGFLRRLYRREDGSVGYRCPAEPEANWIAKGGTPEELEGRKCLCNALLANLGQFRERAGGYMEKPLLTLGGCVEQVRMLIAQVGEQFSASDVIDYLLRDLIPESVPAR